jgi:2-methylcitrate dehydratase PrpD
MAHALDLDNTWHPLNHPTSPTLPAILAKKHPDQLEDVNELMTLARCERTGTAR